MSRLWKLGGGIVAAGVIGLLDAGPAQAHVTVNPAAVSGGNYGQLTFRAPNDEPQANFTRLTIHLPADHPLASVSIRPLDGWKASTTKAKLAKPLTTDDGTVTEYTDSITWTATSGAVAPDQYQNFDVSVGPLPDSGTITFTADQYYSDGTVVHWNEPTKAGAAEPAHPAPVLTLTAASGAASTPAANTVTAGKSSSSNSAAVGLSIAALVVAALTAAATARQWRRSRG